VQSRAANFATSDEDVRVIPVVLVSSDTQLIEAARPLVAAIASCSFEVASPSAAEFELHSSTEPVLLLLHTQAGEAEHAARWLQEVLSARQLIAAVSISDDASPQTALALLRAGAVDVLNRPLDLRRMAFLIDSLTLRARHSAATQSLTGPQFDMPARDFFCCTSPRMENLLRLVQKVAPQDTSVLLTGETGVGKTRLAQLIHDQSHRKDEPFLAVNCAALPENLIESELFGHRKGAFTGADADRTGRFSAVGRGTLLLDEIDSLPLAVQGKLLRALDQRVFEKVGGNTVQRLEARVVVATNRDLEQEAAAGRFRSDLYFRLNVVELRLPPLRDRREAILPIAEQHAFHFASRNRRHAPRFSDDVLAVFQHYDWPGNIRELRNVVERAVTFADAEIRVEHLPERLASLAASVNGRTTDRSIVAESARDRERFRWFKEAENMSADQHEPPATAPVLAARVTDEGLSSLGKARLRAEIDRILEALNKNGNNRSQAARDLGISRVALYKKLHKFGLMTGG